MTFQFLGTIQACRLGAQQHHRLLLSSNKQDQVCLLVSYWSGSLTQNLAVAASFMNTVILTSVLSAGNHAMFAGSRVLYGAAHFYWRTLRFYAFLLGLSVTAPRQAPKIFSWTTRKGVPLPALLLTSSISALCFGSSFVGNGTLWGYLQSIVGVSNQVCTHLFQWLHLN